MEGVQSGDLRHRITIQKQVIAKNSYGEDTVSWSDDATMWAAIYPVRGKQYFEAQQTQAQVSHKIVIRYRTLMDGTLINPKCRVKFKARFFTIDVVINPDERRISLELMCNEGIS